MESLSFRKRVGIRLLPIGGSSWVDVDARYAGVADEGSNVALGSVERWDYGSPIFNTTGGYLLAAYYNNLDTGEWFWDNDFDQNYLTRVPEIE